MTIITIIMIQGLLNFSVKEARAPSKITRAQDHALPPPLIWTQI
jgi:hypothetical protein